MGRRPKQTFLQIRHTDGQEAHEKMLNITNYQRNAYQNCLTLVRIAIIKKSTNNKCWRGRGGKGALLHCWWECKPVQPLWRTLWTFLKKLKIELPYDLAIPLVGIYPEKNMVQKDTCTPMFIAALSTVARTWKQPKCSSTEEQIKKMWYDGILLSHKKEQNSDICREIRGWTQRQSEVSQREKQISYNIAYIWNLEKWQK